MEQPWLVVKTRPQWERIVCRQLGAWYQVPYYCPFKKVKRQYTDRIKIIEAPVLKGYVFVKPKDHAAQIKILQLDGVVEFVKFNNKAASISNNEIEQLKSLIESNGKVSIIQAGQQVRIGQGAFKGQEAIVKAIRKTTVQLELYQSGLVIEATLHAVAG